MIYEVKKNDVTLKVDDNVFFDKQPKEFRLMYEAARTVETKDDDGNVVSMMQSDNVEFDNCYVEVYENGRIIITEKQDENVEI